MAYIDTTDIRYKVPITGGETSVPESTNAYREPLKSPASPVIPVKPEIPTPRLVKGRNVTFENISWVFAGLLVANEVFSFLCHMMA
jgi:hypothetical protein